MEGMTWQVGVVLGGKDGCPGNEVSLRHFVEQLEGLLDEATFSV